MIFGPFTATMMKTITLRLEDIGVAYQFTRDEELLAELEKQRRESASPHDHNRGASYDPAFMILEIDDEAYAAKKSELLALGLGVHDEREPDFNEEYVCPDCDKVVSHEAGFCATHKTPLITWSANVARKREKGTPSSPFATWGWIVAGAALLGYIVFRMIQ